MIKSYTDLEKFDSQERPVACKFATSFKYTGTGQLSFGVKELTFSPGIQGYQRWNQTNIQIQESNKLKWQLLKLPNSIRKIKLASYVDIPLARLQDIKELESVDREAARMFTDKCRRKYAESNQFRSYPEFLKAKFEAAYGWPKLEELIVGAGFDHRVDCLPASLKSLTYKKSKACILNHVGFLPVGLTHFSITTPFIMDGKLPET